MSPVAANEKQLAGYLFTYFAGEAYEDGEQVYFALSRDGLNWTDLNNNRPVLYSTVGAKGVRDPFLLRSAKGDGFWIVATDERIYTDGDWVRAQFAASKGVVVWDSPDLLSWSEPRLVRVARQDAGCTWAPEATYNPATNEYMMYWASLVGAENSKKQTIFCATTRDFHTFSPPEVFIEGPRHIIDTTIIEFNGMYYRYSVNDAFGCIVAERTSALLGGTAERIPAPFLEAQKNVEGPFIFQFNGEHRWCQLVDQHAGIGYYPLITTDLASGDFRVPEEPYKMPTRARHGSVAVVTEIEFEALQRKWSG
jgi:hypothetical protein